MAFSIFETTFVLAASMSIVVMQCGKGYDGVVGNTAFICSSFIPLLIWAVFQGIAMIYTLCKMKSFDKEIHSQE